MNSYKKYVDCSEFQFGLLQLSPRLTSDILDKKNVKSGVRKLMKRCDYSGSRTVALSDDAEVSENIDCPVLELIGCGTRKLPLIFKAKDETTWLQRQDVHHIQIREDMHSFTKSVNSLPALTSSQSAVKQSLKRRSDDSPIAAPAAKRPKGNVTPLLNLSKNSESTANGAIPSSISNKVVGSSKRKSTSNADPINSNSSPLNLNPIKSSPVATPNVHRINSNSSLKLTKTPVSTSNNAIQSGISNSAIGSSKRKSTSNADQIKLNSLPTNADPIKSKKSAPPKVSPPDPQHHPGLDDVLATLCNDVEDSPPISTVPVVPVSQKRHDYNISYNAEVTSEKDFDVDTNFSSPHKKKKKHKSKDKETLDNNDEINHSSKKKKKSKKVKHELCMDFSDDFI